MGSQGRPAGFAPTKVEFFRELDQERDRVRNERAGREDQSGAQVQSHKHLLFPSLLMSVSDIICLKTELLGE